LSVKKNFRKITQHNVSISLNCVTTEKDGSNIANRNGGYNVVNRDGNKRWLFNPYPANVENTVSS